MSTLNTGQVSAGAEPTAQDTAVDGEIPSPVAGETGTNRPADSNRVVTQLLITLVSLAIVYTLALAQILLIPVALAFLLSLVLAPVVRWLARWHIPRTLGAAGVVLLLVAGLGQGVISSLEPLNNWFEQAPQVLRQLERKVSPIKSTVDQVNKAAEQVDRITSVDSEQSVEVKSVSSSAVLFDNAERLISGSLVVTLLLYFFLSWGRVMMIRIGGLLGDSGARRRYLELSTTLEGEVSKYLSVITLINFGLGIVVAATLYVLGMPNPLLWGTVTALFNYIPYLGSLLTAVLLGITALLTFDGLAEPALVLAAFLGLTIFEGQIVTPLVLGRQLALNPLIVFLSVLFWFWLWGIAGALMAVPILITLKLIGDRVDWLRPLAVIAGR
jgi:predicted PurR-regulated permease PerM